MAVISIIPFFIAEKVRCVRRQSNKSTFRPNEPNRLPLQILMKFMWPFLTTRTTFSFLSVEKKNVKELINATALPLKAKV